jgi:hypothetical protein
MLKGAFMQINEEHISTDRAVYEIVTGKKGAGKLEFALTTGRALVFPGTNYYVIKLWGFYNITYYLVKNRDDQTRYTVFSRKIEDDSGIRFLNPVGAGWISTDLPNYLEIKFRFPRQSLFMGIDALQ